ncbi:MAG: hypothetical protein QNJ30_00505 [Kiloniellales bacterium]|nr:hypothetical protein [Kiloniellales bacterium]
MNVESLSSAENAEAPDAGPERQRSTIGFPYIGLSEAIGVAQALHAHVGSGACDDNQLASWLNLSAKSSGFRVRISAARMFGVIDSVSPGKYQLSSLGMAIVDRDRAERAKVEAFLRVPLFDAVYEKWGGRQLPPRTGFERELVGLGVAEKQSDRARQVLERSAQSAGFFHAGRDRLVKPGIKPEEERHSDQGGGTAKVDDNLPEHLDPVIKGLIDKLPRPGSIWPEKERALWLQILENSFKLVYDEEAEPKGHSIREAGTANSDDEGWS